MGKLNVIFLNSSHTTRCTPIQFNCNNKSLRNIIKPTHVWHRRVPLWFRDYLITPADVYVLQVRAAFADSFQRLISDVWTWIKYKGLQSWVLHSQRPTCSIKPHNFNVCIIHTTVVLMKGLRFIYSSYVNDNIISQQNNLKFLQVCDFLAFC